MSGTMAVRVAKCPLITEIRLPFPGMGTSTGLVSLCGQDVYKTGQNM